MVVYGTDACPYCIEARGYLKQRKVASGDFNVKDRGKGQRDYAALGAKVVPVRLKRLQRGSGRGRIGRITSDVPRRIGFFVREETKGQRASCNDSPSDNQELDSSRT